MVKRIELQGIPVSPGIIIGKAHLIDRSKVKVPLRRVDNNSVPYEIERFKKAVEEVKSQLSELKNRLPDRLKEHAFILDTHMMILNDSMLYDATIKRIEEEKINAEWALKKSFEEIKNLFFQIEDRYISERINDVENVVQRILRNLMGYKQDDLSDIDEKSIVVAHDLSPADTAELNPKKIMGFVTDGGGRTSHTAILARALKLPAVMGLCSVTNQVEDGGILIVDGDTGKVIIKDVGIKNIYYLPIPITQHKRGIYKIELRYLEEKQTTSFHYEFKTKNYWTDEIDEVVGVMRYVFPYSEYKQLKGKDDSEKWEAINTYWKEKDPTPETDENELLSELNERVKFSNKNFSILMHGWRSDRGRIYIIYGEPQMVDESYQDNRGYNYQKWVYSNGKEFLFIDRTMSGDYTLHQERF